MDATTERNHDGRKPLERLVPGSVLGFTGESAGVRFPATRSNALSHSGCHQSEVGPLNALKTNLGRRRLCVSATGGVRSGESAFDFRACAHVRRRRVVSETRVAASRQMCSHA